MTTPLRIATRDSPLALWQARRVQALLREKQPGRETDLVTFKATGDLLLQPLLEVGAEKGVGIFTKVLDEALLQDRGDLAVHSFKDYPTDIHGALVFAAVPERGPQRDVLVVRGAEWPDDAGASGVVRELAARKAPILEEVEVHGEALRPGLIGTSSPRRQAQLQLLDAHVVFDGVRGNVGTRLRKLHERRYEALVMAEAGLARLGPEECPELKGLRLLPFDPIAEMLPAPAQGALLVVCRADDAETRALLESIDDAQARACAEAERACLAALGGGCFLPMGTCARVAGGGDKLELDAVLTSPPRVGFEPRAIRAGANGDKNAASQIGREAASRLRSAGAEDLIRAHRAHS